MKSLREQKKLKNFHEETETEDKVLLMGSCLWDHFPLGILPDDCASILTSSKDITLICGMAEVILSPLLSPALVAAGGWSSGFLL